MTLIQILSTTVLIESVILFILFKLYMGSLQKCRDIASKKKSGEVRLGQIAENFAPFLDQCKEYDPKTMHFLGNPIDFLIYDENKIVFMEVKSGNSKLSEKQRRIKKIVEERKVEWKEIRIN